MKSKKKRPIKDSKPNIEDSSLDQNESEQTGEIQIEFGHYGENQSKRKIGSTSSPSLTLDDSQFRSLEDSGEVSDDETDVSISNIEVNLEDSSSLSFGGDLPDGDSIDPSLSKSRSELGASVAAEEDDGLPPPVDEIDDDLSFERAEHSAVEQAASDINIDSIYSGEPEEENSNQNELNLADDYNEMDLDPTALVKEKTEKLDLSRADVSISNDHLQSEFVGNPNLSPTNLTQSENFRVAQQKIKELERDNERLRSENEELASAAETFRNKSDNLEQRTQNAETKYKDLYENVDTEKKILLDSISAKDHEVQKLRQNINDLEKRLQTGVKKIRVRERELENRLELVKMEGKALLQSKDEMILSLKRQIDQISMELENARSKAQESNRILSQKQEVLRKTVKTLRLALSLLETEDIQQKSDLKKVD